MADNATVHVNSPTQKVSRKVQLASIVTFVVTGLATLLVQLLQDGSLIALLPEAVTPFVVPLVPTLVTLVTGFAAKNNARDVNSPGTLQR